MELRHVVGVPVLFTDVDEALKTDWTRHRDRADVVRIQAPPPDRWPELRAAGFRPKPDRVVWIARAEADEAAFLARLTKKERANLRAARRRFAEDGLVLRTQPLDEQLLDAFLPLYENQVAEMRHGLLVAVRQRDAILAAPGGWQAQCVYDAAGALVGGCLSEECPGEDVLRVRFSAVDPRRRQASLSRVMYLETVALTRRLGLGRMSLGTDPNLFGHIAKTGLFGFKARLGFKAVASTTVDPADGADQADLVIGLSALADPSFLLSYADDDDDDGDGDGGDGGDGGKESSGAALRIDLFTQGPPPDVSSYRAAFLRGLTTHRIPEPAAAP